MQVDHSTNLHSDELCHYGVKGMRWGVRHDLRLLANNRRNNAVRKVKQQYDMGKITKDQKKTAIQKANLDKKKYLEKTKREFESTTSQRKRYEMENKIASQAIKEVPNRQLKNGARRVNQMFTGYQIGANVAAATLVATSMPALAPMLIASVAGTTAGALGRQWLIDKGIDKLS